MHHRVAFVIDIYLFLPRGHVQGKALLSTSIRYLRYSSSLDISYHLNHFALVSLATKRANSIRK